MQKLTSKHLSLLAYFANGGQLEQCFSPGRSFGEFANKPTEFTSGLFNSLLTWGLIQFTHTEHFGMRWYQFSISKKGTATFALASTSE